MGSTKSLRYLFYISFLFHCLISTVTAHEDQIKLQNYIIIVQKTNDIESSDVKDVESWHLSLLSKICKESAASKLIYSYNSVVNGFAARLTEQEVNSMSNHPWFVQAILANRQYKPMTTHTSQFLGLRGSNGVWNNSNMGEGIIIGVLDTGVYPNHPSFNDDGMPPPPAKWKGHCDFNASVCNNKLIGAKSFLKGGLEEKMHLPPFDHDGHGTHTSSTAAGAFVKGVKYNGIAMGMASGMAPRAHLAIYKVCSNKTCEDVDILKAMEEAVNDGVDVISMSLGNNETRPLYDDSSAVAGYYAIMKGVFLSCSAGNAGPKPGTLSNVAPWALTVGAGTIDRLLTSTVKLGNGLQLDGGSAYQPKNWTKHMVPLVYLGSNGNIEAGRCYNDTLDTKLVRGKIVVCDRGGNGRIEKGQNVLKAGGIGMILINSKDYKYSINADKHVLPASHLNFQDGEKIKNYMRSTANPTATFFFRGVVTHVPWSPMVANFSSRGPNLVSPLILKPDIIGPGVDVFAAVPPNFDGDKNSGNFESLSGTSMAAPHLSGIAALIKKAHPDWTPAAIKSAIITTAYTKTLAGEPIGEETTHNPITQYDMGAGHVNPSKALDPGLVYDLIPEDYIPYLCSLNYNNSMIGIIIQPTPPVDCAKVKSIPEEQLNYPSISIPLKANRKIIIKRTVTNVGEAKAKYRVSVNVPKGLAVKVKPAKLRFTSLGQKKSFQLIVKWTGSPLKIMYGDLKWVSNKHVVRSPISLVKLPRSFSTPS